MNLGAICDSFINPAPYLEMDDFLPFFYTENAADIYKLLFFLQTDFCVIYNKEKCMLDANIKCLCLKYVEIDLVKCPYHHKFARIVHYQCK